MTAPDSRDVSPSPANGSIAGNRHPPATPRWVKVTGAAVGVIVLVVLARMLFGGGLAEHGPGMHGGIDQAPTSTRLGAVAPLARPGA